MPSQKYASKPRKMKKIYITWLYLFCSLASVLGARKNATATTTTSKPILALLDMFYQSDYKVNYEWGETVHVNQRFGDYKGIAFKYNRTTTAINFTFCVNVDMGYDLEVIVQMYKFSSNEYRVFPMRFEVNFCEAVTKGALGSNTFSKNGNFSCPLIKGRRYTAFNWVPDGSRLPPLIPTGKYMIELQYLYYSDEVLLTRGYVSISRPLIGFED